MVERYWSIRLRGFLRALRGALRVFQAFLEECLLLAIPYYTTPVGIAFMYSGISLKSFPQRGQYLHPLIMIFLQFEHSGGRTLR